MCGRVETPGRTSEEPCPLISRDPIGISEGISPLISHDPIRMSEGVGPLINWHSVEGPLNCQVQEEKLGEKNRAQQQTNLGLGMLLESLKLRSC